MPIDEQEFRRVLGHFATGVTIVTARIGKSPDEVVDLRFLALPSPAISAPKQAMSTPGPSAGSQLRRFADVVSARQACCAAIAIALDDGAAGGKGEREFNRVRRIPL